ncbi:MAG: hypothetical protein ACRDD1_13600, partial [Planctomycetia bacterium]
MIDPPDRSLPPRRDQTMNRRRPFLLSSMLATAVVFLFVTVGDRPDAALPSAAAAPAEAAKRVVVPFDA